MFQHVPEGCTKQLLNNLCQITHPPMKIMKGDPYNMKLNLQKKQLYRDFQHLLPSFRCFSTFSNSHFDSHASSRASCQHDNRPPRSKAIAEVLGNLAKKNPSQQRLLMNFFDRQFCSKIHMQIWYLRNTYLYERRSKPLVHWKDIKGWVSFFLMDPIVLEGLD